MPNWPRPAGVPDRIDNRPPSGGVAAGLSQGAAQAAQHQPAAQGAPAARRFRSFDSANIRQGVIKLRDSLLPQELIKLNGGVCNILCSNALRFTYRNVIFAFIS